MKKNNRPAKKNFNIRKPKNNKIYEEEKSDLLKKYQKQKKNKEQVYKEKTRPAKKIFRIKKSVKKSSDLLRRKDNKRRKNSREIFYSWSEILLGLSTPKPRGKAQ